MTIPEALQQALSGAPGRAQIAMSVFLLVSVIGLRAQQTPEQGPEALPILGLAGVTFQVSDLDAARGFYDGVIGLPEAFTIEDAAGRVTSVFFKVNDNQFVEIVPGLEPGALHRMVRVMIQSSDLERLHTIYANRGLNPSPIIEGPDGNPVFRIIGPSDANLDFLEYAPDSDQSRLRGQLLPDTRLSTHLWHVGIYSEDRAAGRAFFENKLGFAGGRELPGGRNESIDTANSDQNLETKYPPLDPENPATRAQYEREVMGAVEHMALEVADMRAARDLAQQRGNLTDLQVRAHVGNNRHWLMHLFDPDGSRTEVMETALQEELPPMTVMAPGREVAPPILPKVPRTIPWP